MQDINAQSTQKLHFLFILSFRRTSLSETQLNWEQIPSIRQSPKYDQSWGICWFCAHILSKFSLVPVMSNKRLFGIIPAQINWL